jgi:RimJ/RimL family protein N-acetyltransferase
MTRTNEYQQPIGDAVDGWSARPRPARTVIDGKHCRIEPLDVAQHAADLFDAYGRASNGSDWTYLFAEPFSDFESFQRYLTQAAASADPLHYAVIDKASNKAVGTFALMRIEPVHGVIEVGSVTFSPLLKQTRISTEAQYLLMRYVFDDLKYRRYEWKCDSLNAPSRKTAARLGFEFEGIFRQAIVYKGRNRDTAWYAIIDRDWPRIEQAFERWLADDNFDASGTQRKSLAQLRDGA